MSYCFKEQRGRNIVAYQEDLISIIIPVYNLECLIENCIVSVINQSYRNLEILLVDDGSKDNSLKICQKYEKEDSRIRVIHKSNGGPSSARNVGLDNASGKYITYIDGDDNVSLDYILYLYNLLKKNHADMSICNFITYSSRVELDHIKKDIDVDIEKIYVMNRHEALEAFLYQRFFPTSNGCRMYHKDILKGERFPEGNCADDVATNYKFIMKAHKVVYSTKKLYYYFQHQNSIVHSWLSQREYDCEKSSREMYDEIKKNYPNLEKAACSKFFSSNVQILSYIPIFQIYKKEHQVILCNIKKLRKAVLLNRSTRLVNRVSAAASYIGIWFLRICLLLFYS